MAREEVFGITRPHAAMMGTTSKVVRLPGRPPTQCLSTTSGASQRRRWPAAIMAAVSEQVSAASSRLPEQAAIMAASSISE
jgi:hypothetical protein